MPIKVFITGMDGFVGTHLYNLLKTDDKYEVRGIDNRFHPCSAPGKADYGDIRCPEEINKYIEWCDWTIALAAQIHVDRSMEFPHETVDINVLGTLNVLDACARYGKRMVFASSSEVYGSSQEEYMSETHPLDGQSPYAATKIAGDRLCKAYFDSFGTKVVILRNFNTFGEWQADDSYGGVIAKFTKAALLGEPLKIYGSGEQERDYMHVKDAVRMYMKCMEIEEYGTPINMGTGKTVKINDLAQMIVRLTNSSSPIEHISARPGEVMRLCADISKAKKLGLNPTTDFLKDLTSYVRWYETNQLDLRRG